MVQVNIREAKTQLSRLLKLVEAGRKWSSRAMECLWRGWWRCRRSASHSQVNGRGSSSSTRASLTRYLRNSWPTLSHNRYAQLRKPRST